MNIRHTMLILALTALAFSACNREGNDAHDAHSGLSAEVRDRITHAFEHYDKIRHSLAQDHLGDVEQHVGAIIEHLTRAADKAEAPDVAHGIHSVIDEAEALRTATDLEDARDAFGRLSSAWIAMGTHDPRLLEGLHAFQCPMAEGHPNWLQRHPEMENPYMGQEMLACGVDVELAQGEAHQPTVEGEIAYYTCPMHPSVRSNDPGQCPICGMDLTAISKEDAESGVIVVDEVRRQRIGVRIETVSVEPLHREVRALGTVTVDETGLSEVNLRIGGWVQDLRADETGQRVERGEVLFTLYSPELYAAQQEYLTAQKAGLDRLLEAAESRLLLLGMTRPQVRELAARGTPRENVPILSPATGYVVEKNVVAGSQVASGSTVFRIANLDRIWIDAELYESDIGFAREGQSVRVILPHAPGDAIEGQVDYIHPTMDADRRTVRARVVLENEAGTLKPGMFAEVLLEAELGERLSVPESAVLYTGPRRIVFVDLGEGRLEPREVKLGARAHGRYVVDEGLKEGERIVASGNFLIASESRLRTSAGPSGTQGEEDDDIHRH